METKFVITPQVISLSQGENSYSINSTHPNFSKVKEALVNKDTDQALSLIDIPKSIANYTKNNIQILNGDILINGITLPPELSKKIFLFQRENKDPQPLINFATKLSKLLNIRIFESLFNFLDYNGHPITKEGNFIAYKKVKSNFKDIHSGKFDNSPGTTVEMSASEVDDNPNRTCSTGLHVAAWDYAANNFGNSQDVLLEVEVDPQDVIAIPIDYNSMKMRTCKYKVIKVVEKPNDSNTVYEDDLEEEDYCDEDCDDEDNE